MEENAATETHIKRERLDKAQLLIFKAEQNMTEEEFVAVMDELGWFDALSYNDGGQLVFTLNELQQVGLAAALLASWEAR